MPLFKSQYIVDIIPLNIGIMCGLKEKLEKISLFKNSEILDSTRYFRKAAQQKLLLNKFIFFEDDTHLNEEGLDIFSDFILNNLN